MTVNVDMGEIQHFVIELADGADKTFNASAAVIKQISNSAAIRTFRRTVKTEGLVKPLLNAAGNLRGNVISRKARTIYSFASNAGEKLAKAETAFVILNIAVELAKDAGNMNRVYENKGLSNPEKAAQLAMIADVAAVRGVTSVLPTGFHYLAKSLEGYLELGGVVFNSDAPLLLAGDLDKLDAKVTAYHEQILDGPAIIDRLQKLSDTAPMQEFANWISLHVDF